MVSAKTVAQKPWGNVSPPLSGAQATVLAAAVLLAALVSVVLVPSFFAQAATVMAISNAGRCLTPRVIPAVNMFDLMNEGPCLEEMAKEKKPSDGLERDARSPD